MSPGSGPSPIGRVLLAVAVLSIIGAGVWVASLARRKRADDERAEAGEQAQAAEAQNRRRIVRPPAEVGWRGPEEDEVAAGARRAGEGSAGPTPEGIDGTVGGGDGGAVPVAGGIAAAATGEGNGATGAGGTEVGAGESPPSTPGGSGPHAPAGAVNGSAISPGALGALGVPGAGADPYAGRTGPLPADTPRATVLPAPMRSPGGAPFLITTISPGKIQAGQDVLVTATLVDGAGGIVPPTVIEVSVIRHGEPEPGTYLPMQPADPSQPAQFVFHATAPSDEPAPGAPPLLMHFFIRASAMVDGAPVDRGAAGSFSVHNPGARLDPASARVARVGPDIVLSAQLDVRRVGTFVASAELWGGADANRPVAFARIPLDSLQPGRQTLSLVFGGAVVRASNVDGPYVVRNVQLIETDSNPPHEQDPIQQLPPTPAWRHTDF